MDTNTNAPAKRDNAAENEQRWLLYRKAREAGWVDGDAYDRFLHPRYREPFDVILDELANGPGSTIHH